MTKTARHTNPIADWLFREFVSMLKADRIRILRKRWLVDPDASSRVALRGLMDPELRQPKGWAYIFINPAKQVHKRRDDEVETLIHELAHVLLPKTSERKILRIEDILTKTFTREQRAILKQFIPRHEVKHYPRQPALRTSRAI